MFWLSSRPVPNKGYHPGAPLEQVKRHQVRSYRSYIAERQPRASRSGRAKPLSSKLCTPIGGGYMAATGRVCSSLGELVESSFANCYDTGQLWRMYLRKTRTHAAVGSCGGVQPELRAHLINIMGAQICETLMPSCVVYFCSGAHSWAVTYTGAPLALNSLSRFYATLFWGDQQIRNR